MLDILVIIAAYNEENTVGQVVRDTAQQLKNKSHLILVISDGSTDNTKLEAERAGAIVYHKYHGGRADTFRYSMRFVYTYKPKIIVITDADGQYRAKDILKLLRAISRGNDLVLGSRLRGRIEHMTLTKKWLNIIATTLLQRWLKQDITDVTTGLRAFTPAIAQLPIKSKFTFTTEQIIRTARASYKINSVPVVFLKRQDGTSRLMKSPLHYIWATLRDARRILS